MSVQAFCQRLQQANYGKNDKKWFPKWIRRYCAAVNCESGRIEVSLDDVISFLRSLLQNKTPAWQRLQAVRAIEAYRNLVLDSPRPCLLEIKTTLSRLAEKESIPGAQLGFESSPRDLVGQIDPNEPKIIQQMRRELRLHYRQLDTERAYIGWVRRFTVFCGSADVSSFSTSQIRAFLSSLAVDHNVAPNTQKQAKAALLFLYQKVLGRELEFLDIVPSDKPARLPVVLSRDEINAIYPYFIDVRKLMFGIMYGAGLRHRECRRLRLKDPCFDEGHIIVRNGKGAKDRISVMPEACRNMMKEQIRRVSVLHQEDLDRGFGSVFLPFALERKYKNENKRLCWQWLFPSFKLSKDPRSGSIRRHHISEEYFGKYFRK